MEYYSSEQFNNGGPLSEQPYRISDFEIQKELGSGMFGETFSVRDLRNNTTAVIKRLLKNKVSREDVEREVTILHKLSSVCESYILCFKKFFEDDKYYYILTEFLGNWITLTDYIEQPKRRSNETLKQIILNMLLGLKQIHDNGVAHQDIKPDNIMINPQTNEIKYIDFGFACDEKLCSMQEEPKGSPAYAPPEFINREAKPSLRTIQKGDIWSLGITIFELIFGEEPIYRYIDLFIIPKTGYFSYSYDDLFAVLRDMYFSQTFFNIVLRKLLRDTDIDPKIQEVIWACLKYNPEDRSLNKAISIFQ